MQQQQHKRQSPPLNLIGGEELRAPWSRVPSPDVNGNSRIGEGVPSSPRNFTRAVTPSSNDCGGEVVGGDRGGHHHQQQQQQQKQLFRHRVSSQGSQSKADSPSHGFFSRWSPSPASSRLGIFLARRGSISSPSSTSSSSMATSVSTTSSLSRENSTSSTHSNASLDPDVGRNRSGSFNYPRTRNVDSLSNSSLHSRERSLTDLKSSNNGSSRAMGPQPPFSGGYHSLTRARSRRIGRGLSGLVNGVSNANNSLDEIELEEIQCLLPNGIIIDVVVHPDDEVCHIKQVVLNRATTDERLPLRGCLNPDGNHYVVTYVNSFGRLEECYDEKKTLREIKPFQNLLKFAKRVKDKGHYQFKKHVGTLIGKNLSDFDELRNCEVNEFRWRMKVFANKIAQERKNKLATSLEAKIRYQYPPRIVSHPKGKHNWKSIKVSLMWGDKEKSEVLANSTPSELIALLAAEFGHSEEYSRRCFIKIVGEDSFLMDNHRIIDYEYVRQRVALAQLPKLVVINAETIDIEQANETIYQSLENDVCTLSQDQYASDYSLTALSLNTLGLQQHSAVPSTTVEQKFSVRVESLALSSSETACVGAFRTMGMHLGLFHGGKRLCSMLTHTFKSPPNESGVVGVHQTFDFDLHISNIPRMAKLCVGIYEIKKGQNHPLFWVNTNLFDYRAKLKWKSTFHMWNYIPGDCMPTHHALSPLRQSISNPNVKEAADIILSFACMDCWVEFPARDSSSSSSSTMTDQRKAVSSSSTEGAATPEAPHGGTTFTKLYSSELKNIADHDPLHDLTVQEKDLIWKIREYCLTQLPELLPRIIDCVDYCNQSHVRELAGLLDRWPLLKPERALQLLDYAYPDENVRRFAVRCLREAPDSVILNYLLQLAQALKHESYFHCELVEFLLERALNNQHIGHHLFWELRAEMNSPSVGLLFGLILEAYLTAAPEHLRNLEHQNTLLQKCRATQSSLQSLEIVSKSHEKAKNRFQASTKAQFDGHNPYVNFVSPLNPGRRCQKIKLEQCKLMNSKMRPQMLAFQNVDSGFHNGLSDDLEDVVIIYKKGDDLRQDRLTLQLLKVMDLLWKDAGLDLRLSCYRCTSTDMGEGFIEVVQRAETICRIQMAQADFKTTAVFRKGLLLSWIKSHSAGEESLRQAQYEFTQSCAGYSVAMYILGIGDRHNDNIMVKTNGQLFHIDFGHFLGNFKHKFGIKRERVPMVLSSEFVEVIKANFGRRNNFERFRELCERAFLTIRKHGSLIISLLAMMISTGLPELSSEQDLNIIRSTLHLDRTEEDALDHFRKDFNESLRNAWTISMDWFFHMMNQRPSGKG